MVAYPVSMSETVDDVWPHRDALREIRAGRSLERVARMIDVNRVTWHKWETGQQRPSHDNLRAIVEAFDVPPDLVGYEPPKGWELVPSAWLAARFDELFARLDVLGASCDAAIERMPSVPRAQG